MGSASKQRGDEILLSFLPFCIFSAHAAYFLLMTDTSFPLLTSLCMPGRVNAFKAHPRTPLMDQDALNVASDGLWKKLDSRWNFQDAYDKGIWGSGASIVHFVTKHKPWLAKSRHRAADFYDAFGAKIRFARTPYDKLADPFRRLQAGIKNVCKRGFRK